MKEVYRVLEKEALEDGSYRTTGESFYGLERLVKYLQEKKAYYKNLKEPITINSIKENITDTYYTDIIIPKSKESIWDMMGIPNKDTLIWVGKITIWN